MLKICPCCHKTFSGGRACPACGVADLLDVADPGTRPHLRQSELQQTINTYYGARSAMLLLFFGMLLGGVAALALMRHGSLAPAAARPLWFAAAGVAFLAATTLALLAGGRLVHLFSAICRGRPPTLDDLRQDLHAGRARHDSTRPAARATRGGP